ncbi:MAG TPA: hypothetical protein DCK99_17275 [Blastocatellia bacterium]|nr:hypothetical protein [Blastocatellia bacterium]
MPDDKLIEWFSGVEPNRKGQWMITIAPKDGSLTLQASAERQFDLSQYLNRFDFISKSIPRSASRPPSTKRDSEDSSDIIAAIKSNNDLNGDSLHDRVIDMIAQIGKWSGYVPTKGYKVPQDSPYQIDVVWLNRDLLELAVEVQIGGNETEAKDRLVHAKRFGARKILIVSKVESLKRLKQICRYEPDLKNWLEIWSIVKVYRMYLAGQQFFELFRPFEKQQWSQEIREIT